MKCETYRTALKSRVWIPGRGFARRPSNHRWLPYSPTPIGRSHSRRPQKPTTHERGAHPCARKHVWAARLSSMRLQHAHCVSSAVRGARLEQPLRESDQGRGHASVRDRVPRITTAPALQDCSHVCHFPTSVAQVTAVMECIDVAGLHRWPKPMGEAFGVRVCKLARSTQGAQLEAGMAAGRACVSRVAESFACACPTVHVAVLRCSVAEVHSSSHEVHVDHTV